MYKEIENPLQGRNINPPAELIEKWYNTISTLPQFHYKELQNTGDKQDLACILLQNFNFPPLILVHFGATNFPDKNLIISDLGLLLHQQKNRQTILPYQLTRTSLEKGTQTRILKNTRYVLLPENFRKEMRAYLS
ncbi:hypothetical protein H6501_00975 [Candidatus Woesearchaeota archaeon]|nr:hypothetical protein [Candidatus Woesearchaeota archaeon]USN44679.1 MAG: hypothetical protein H6500_02450 [Candidatus Woesearchaeota archaeon]